MGHTRCHSPSGDPGPLPLLPSGSAHEQHQVAHRPRFGRRVGRRSRGHHQGPPDGWVSTGIPCTHDHLMLFVLCLTHPCPSLCCPCRYVPHSPLSSSLPPFRMASSHHQPGQPREWRRSSHRRGGGEAAAGGPCGAVQQLRFRGAQLLRHVQGTG